MLDVTETARLSDVLLVLVVVPWSDGISSSSVEEAEDENAGEGAGWGTREMGKEWLC